MIAYTLLFFGVIAFGAPILVMVSMSLKSPQEIAMTSPWSLPQKPTLGNYAFILTDPGFDFARKAVNTLFLTVVPTIGVVLTSALVAYPFARLEFPGKTRLFTLLIATMMLPGVVMLIPNYMLNASLGWIDTYFPFTVPAFLGGGAFNIFLIRQYMLGIPKEMDEAAQIDGASNALLFWRMILPNCGPVLATVAVFTAVACFRDFTGPFLLINSVEKQTLELALRGLQSQHKTDWHYLMAGSVIVLAPITLLFIMFQRYFVPGISLTGGK